MSRAEGAGARRDPPERARTVPGATRGRQAALSNIVAKAPTTPARAPDPMREDVLAALASGGAQLPPDAVAFAEAAIDRASERENSGAASTVVAVAGATGSGKSSLVNALAGLQVAAVGVRRPTTSTVTACVWGEIDDTLLDWLGVPRRHRTERVSALDADTQAPLEGLVLLDLPDHDSTATEHRHLVDRLVAQVDLLVWVVDPQKYADAALHEGYLRRLGRHTDLVLVVLNQIDTLDDAGRAACAADVTRLLREDGLDRSPVLLTSARTGEGIEALRARLQEAVAEHTAAWQRGRADLAVAVDRLRGSVAPAEPDPEQVEGADELVGALAVAAGVPALTDAVRASRIRAGRASTGWPFTRWAARLRPDPLRRLHLGGRGAAGGGADDGGDGDADRRALGAAQAAALVSLQRTSLPAPTATQRAAVSAASRRVAASAGSALPPRWAQAVRTAVTTDDAGLSDALDQALAAVPLTRPAPRWWRLVSLLQAVLAVAVLAGLAWLAVLGALAWLHLPEPSTPAVGQRPAVPVPTLMLIGGVVLGLLLAAVSRAGVRSGARRVAASVRRAASHAVAMVAHERLLLRMDEVLERHRLTRTHLDAAARHIGDATTTGRRTGRGRAGRG